MFDACIRSVMLYAGETWALTKKLESVFFGCDRRMLRYSIWLGSRDEIGCRVRMWRGGVGWPGGDVGGCSFEEKIGVVWTRGKEG